ALHDGPRRPRRRRSRGGWIAVHRVLPTGRDLPLEPRRPPLAVRAGSARDGPLGADEHRLRRRQPRRDGRTESRPLASDPLAGRRPRHSAPLPDPRPARRLAMAHEPNVPEQYLEGLFRLDGQIAIVTGGASGLGEAMAHGLAQAGATVVIADFNHEAARAVEASVAGRDYTLHPHRVDVTKR